LPETTPARTAEPDTIDRVVKIVQDVATGAGLIARVIREGTALLSSDGRAKIAADVASRADRISDETR
jgi:hypothetical protein